MNTDYYSSGKKINGTFLLFMQVLAGIIGIILTSLIGQDSNTSSIKILETEVSIAVVSFTFTAFIGFIISVRAIGDKQSDRINKSIDVNSNLIEVSDWLTKIIIVAFIFQGPELIKTISDTAATYGPIISADPTGRIIVFAVIIYFAAAGFYFGFSFLKLGGILTHLNKTKTDTQIMNYKNAQDLSSILYILFLKHMREREINAQTGSGHVVAYFISSGVNNAILSNELPAAFDIRTGTREIAVKLDKLSHNVSKLANQMADDAISENTHELHEWSLDRVKRKLCPIWPFLKEPCSQYAD